MGGLLPIRASRFRLVSIISIAAGSLLATPTPAPESEEDLLRAELFTHAAKNRSRAPFPLDRFLGRC